MLQNKDPAAGGILKYKSSWFYCAVLTSFNIGAANFSPATLTVKIGTTVTWKNNDNVAHTATSDNGTTFNTGDIAAGASKTYTTNLAGTFPYHCTYHPGMTGSLVVTN